MSTIQLYGKLASKFFSCVFRAVVGSGLDWKLTVYFQELFFFFFFQVNGIVCPCSYSSSAWRASLDTFVSSLGYSQAHLAAGRVILAVIPSPPCPFCTPQLGLRELAMLSFTLSSRLFCSGAKSHVHTFLCSN